MYLALPVGGLAGLHTVVKWWHLDRITLEHAIVAAILVGVIPLVSAQGLILRRIWGWWLNWVAIIVYHSRFIPTSLPKTLHGAEATEFAINTAILIFLLWANYIYWKKRKCLFEKKNNIGDKKRPTEWRA